MKWPSKTLKASLIDKDANRGGATPVFWSCSREVSKSRNFGSLLV